MYIYTHNISMEQFLRFLVFVGFLFAGPHRWASNLDDLRLGIIDSALRAGHPFFWGGKLGGLADMNGSWNWEIPLKKEFLNPRHPNTSWVTICVLGKFKSMNVYDFLVRWNWSGREASVAFGRSRDQQKQTGAIGAETPERPRWITVVHSIRNHPENRESGSSSKIRNGMDFWWFQNREDGFGSFPFNNESGERTYWRRLSSPTWQDGFFPAFLGICWAESVSAWQCLGGCSLIRGWWWFKGQSGWGCSVWLMVKPKFDGVDSGVAFHHVFFLKILAG